MLKASTDKDIFILYTLIVAVYVFVLLAKKTYYKVKFDREYWILPRLKINSISGISMMTAMNISLIISISLLSNQIMGIFFRVYPGARFLIENILIKLGGILFGPLIGIFIGFITDLMTVIFTSSVLNYGYFFAAMMNGFLGGMIHFIVNIKDPTKVKPFIASSLFALASLVFLGSVLNSNSISNYFSAKILSFSISFHWLFLFYLMSLITIGLIFMLFLSVFALNHIHDPRYSHKKWIKFFSQKNMFFLILVSNCSIYLLIDIIALPLFDINLSSLPYEQFLISRIITSIPALLLFSYLIHYVYKLYLNIKTISGGATTLEVGLRDPKEKSEKTFLPNLIH